MATVLSVVTLVQSEEEVLHNSVIPDALPLDVQAAAEAADLDTFTGITSELPG